MGRPEVLIQDARQFPKDYETVLGILEDMYLGRKPSLSQTERDLLNQAALTYLTRAERQVPTPTAVRTPAKPKEEPAQDSPLMGDDGMPAFWWLR